LRSLTRGSSVLVGCALASIMQPYMLQKSQ
jgi:hypothetical protein